MFRRKASTSVSLASDLPVSNACAQAEQESLELTVMFTTVSATLAALREAGRLAYQLGARIRILVPHVVPYALPIQCPPVDPLLRIRKFRTSCCYGTVDTRIEVRLCRDAQKCVEDALTAESIVLIGGRKRLWPTRATRLAKNLERAGYHALFVRYEQEIHESSCPEPIPIVD